MSKKVKLLITILAIAFVAVEIAVLAAIAVNSYKIYHDDYYAHPIYNSYNDQTNVVVDGIEYKRGCMLDSSRIGELIGFLDDTSYPIYRIEGDVNKNFLGVEVPAEMKGYWWYYRTDFIFPKTSPDTIDKMEWMDAKSWQTIVVSDQDAISEFFDHIDRARTLTVKNRITARYATVSVYSKDAPGLIYTFSIELQLNGTFVCTFMEGNERMICSIPTDLLERIAGYKLDVDDQVEALKKSAGLSN